MTTFDFGVEIDVDNSVLQIISRENVKCSKL